MTRLTLDLDDDLLARAKELAAAKQITVEEMLKNWLRLAAKPLRKEDLPPNTLAALGMAKGISDGRSDRELLEEALEEKYGPAK